MKRRSWALRRKSCCFVRIYSIRMSIRPAGHLLCQLFAVGHVCSLGRLIASICKTVLYVKVTLQTAMDYFHNCQSHQGASRQAMKFPLIFHTNVPIWIRTFAAESFGFNPPDKCASTNGSNMTRPRWPWISRDCIRMSETKKSQAIS